MANAIVNRQNKEKSLILEMLKKTPIVQIVCEKNGVGRATYYRWRQSDPEFAEETDEALAEGTLLMNDLAESQLLSLIKDGNLGAIVFWLRNHHTSYTNRVEITAKMKTEEKLTPEQEELITKALKLVALQPEDEEGTNKNG
jgi:hypothetical protein